MPTDPMDDYNPKKWSFGDKIENGAASYDNPTRFGFFIRRRVRNGKMNSGAYVEMTDGRGNFWEGNAREGHQLARIQFSRIIPH